MRAPGLHTLYPCASCPLQKGRGLCWRPAKGTASCGHLLLWDTLIGPVGVRGRVFLFCFAQKLFWKSYSLKTSWWTGVKNSERHTHALSYVSFLCILQHLPRMLKSLEVLGLSCSFSLPYWQSLSFSCSQSWPAFTILLNKKSLTTRSLLFHTPTSLFLNHPLELFPKGCTISRQKRKHSLLILSADDLSRGFSGLDNLPTISIILLVLSHELQAAISVHSVAFTERKKYTLWLNYSIGWRGMQNWMYCQMIRLRKANVICHSPL